MELSKIDVEADSLPANLSETLPLLRGLCAKSLEIKTKLTTTLSKPSFHDIIPSSMSGKGNCKITKEYLAESIISLINMVDAVAPIVNTEPPVLHIGTSLGIGKKDTESFNTYLNDVQSKLNDYSNTLLANQQRYDEMFKSLSNLILEHNLHPTLEPTSPAMVPNTSSPHATSKVPCEPYVRYTQDAITDNLKSSLESFISDNESEFKTIGCRDTMYFGDYGYKYDRGAGKHEAKEMPTPLKELLDHVKPLLSDHAYNLNSCLVTRYKTGSDFIPPHRDDEPVFNPDSEIVTVSIGSCRTMKFVDNSGKSLQELKLEDKSVLISSRKSQNFWQHSIEKTNETCGVRYSFTFRHIAPHFLNSTIIIGDSNTKFLQFGDDKGKFGKWMPGKRIESLHVENIPDPVDIGPYRNIVIHTGINNIKTRNRQSIRSLSNILESTCRSIVSVYPKSKVYLSLLLPTKLESLNYHVREFNSILHDLSHSIKNVNVIDHPLEQLCNSHGCLKDEFGRYNQEAQGPLSRDTLHLGKKGLRVFARTIKSSVVGKFKSRAPVQQEATAGQTHPEGSQSSR